MPTRGQYMDYLHSLIGYYGAGAGHAENDTPFNTWYYGRRVSGLDYAWCVVLQRYVMNHFGILGVNGGKEAYVPGMPAVGKHAGAKVWSRPGHGSDAYQPGNQIGFDFNRSGEAEHTGTYWKPRDSTTFYSIDGNTGNDQVAIRIRNYSDVLFVVELLGVGTTPTTPPTAKDDDVPGYVSLGLSKPLPVTLKEGTKTVLFDVEASDKGNRHQDKTAAPGILIGGKNGTLYSCHVKVTGPATWSLVETNPDDKWSVHDTNEDGGPDLCDPNMHLWLRVHPHGDGDVSVSVKTFYWDR